METNNLPTRSPFDDADADIIFHSCDGVAFRLYKNIAAKASPVFRDMFSLPSQTTSTTEQAAETPQVVPLTERSYTLERLFRLCYPVGPPQFSTIDDVRTTLTASAKYMMDGLTPALEDALLCFLSVEPLRVYAIAYLFHLGTAARQAARKLLEIPSFAEPSRPPPEFGDLPALALYAVMVYRSSCVKAALAKISWHQNHKLMSHSPEHPYSPWIWRSCRAHPVQAGTPTVQTSEKIIDSRGTVIAQLGEPTQWWWEYINSLTAALSTRLVPRLATDLSLLEPPVTEASKCPTCQPRALREMIEFSKNLEWEIEQAINMVQITLPF